MAIINYVDKRYLTASDIKKEIMDRLGLDYKSKEDQRTYKRIYDVYALRVRNYTRQQNLEYKLNPNEELLLTLRRQQNGIPLTARQSAILSTSSQNAQRYALRVERNDPRIVQQGILNLENQFKELLEKNTRGYKEKYEEFKTVEVKRAVISNSDGELIGIYNLTEGENPPAVLPEGYNIEYETVRELRTDLTVQEVKEYLETLADDLHAWQKSQMKGNRAVLTKAERRRIGS